MLIVHTIPCYIPNIEYKSNANAKTTTALLTKGTQEACKGKKCVWSSYKKVYNYSSNSCCGGIYCALTLVKFLLR